MADYPKRESHFAHKFCRLVMKSCVATELGQDVALLLMGIAMVEDSKRYSGAVSYYNEQLAPVLGFANVKALQRARERAVDAGWLTYIAGARGRPARYWVNIPAESSAIDDAGMGSEVEELRTDTRQKTTRNTSTECPQSVLNLSTECPTIIPSPVPGPEFNTHPASPTDELQEAKQHVAKWKMPTTATDQTRDLLALWQRSRKAQHGRYTTEAEWEPTVMRFVAWTGAVWDKCLLASASSGTKGIAEYAANKKSAEPEQKPETYWKPVPPIVDSPCRIAANKAWAAAKAAGKTDDEAFVEMTNAKNAVLAAERAQ